LGSNVHEGIEEAIIQLERRFFNVTRRVVIAALEDACKWYKKRKNSSSELRTRPLKLAICVNC
jgi:hypothetical protein